MRTLLWLLSLVLAVAVAVGVTYFFLRDRPIAEGPIQFAEFRRHDGSTEGFTRVNMQQAVPSGNGSWNIKATGKLYKDFVLIYYTDRKELGPEVVPTSRLVRIQFLDGEPQEAPK